LFRSCDLPLDQALHALDRELDAFSGSSERMDDVTSLAVERLTR
jgi:hypothetical protein